MTLDGVLFLAAQTDRSRAYAQAMAAAGLSPERVLLFGKNADGPAATGSRPGGGDLFVPDLGVPLEDTCAEAGWTVERSPAGDVNDEDVRRRLRAAGPALAVYSGYGGQLVGPAVLGLGIDFLHLHAGWLPDYRGSTTIYYSLLKERRCGVSALVLDTEIDAGPIMARRHYPLPPPGMDVDRYYDNMIRADLLIGVLREYAATGALPRVDDSSDGTTYFVIHPVLKHLALLSLETGRE